MGGYGGRWFGRCLVMDDELNKQKKLVDCVDNLNCVLEAFDRLENWKSKILPIIDSFDLNHSNTYLELTEKLSQELFRIRFFSEHAANKLVEYRQLGHPDQEIYSLKEQKDWEQYGIEPVGSLKRTIKEQSLRNAKILKELEKRIDNMIERHQGDA